MIFAQNFSINPIYVIQEIQIKLMNWIEWIGGESHASGREPLPEMKLENSILGDTNNDLTLIQLTTPPHTITLNQHSFPTVDQINDFNLKDNSTNNKSLNKKKRNIALSGLTPNTNDEIVA
jgi:hypothetical protein